MLRDLEELVLRVPDEEAREQVLEAVRCYQAGAYRASVVMAESRASRPVGGRVSAEPRPIVSTSNGAPAGEGSLRDKVLQVLKAAGRAMTKREVAKSLRVTEQRTKDALTTLRKKKLVQMAGNRRMAVYTAA